MMRSELIQDQRSVVSTTASTSSPGVGIGAIGWYCEMFSHSPRTLMPVPFVLICSTAAAFGFETPGRRVTSPGRYALVGLVARTERASSRPRSVSAWATGACASDIGAALAWR
jgi:hypothetical protein